MRSTIARTESLFGHQGHVFRFAFGKPWRPVRLRIATPSRPWFLLTLQIDRGRSWGPIAADLVGESELPTWTLEPNQALEISVQNVDASTRPFWAALDVEAEGPVE